MANSVIFTGMSELIVEHERLKRVLEYNEKKAASD